RPDPAVRVSVVPASLAKGLEYDHVVAVEPAEIVAAEPRGLHRLYVVLTRAVSRLSVVHARPLPGPLATPAPRAEPATGPAAAGAGSGGRPPREGVIVEGRIVTPDGIVDGRVRVEADRIAGIEPGVTGSDAVIVPGFVDLHHHGGGGHTVTGGDPDAVRAAADFHLRHGTTTLLASLVSAPPGQLRAATG